MIDVLDQHFSQLNTFLQSTKPSKIFILCDENTHEFCLPILLPNMETEAPIEILEIEAGEEMKTFDTAIQLFEILVEMEADRKSLMINLGGGVITDMGGFVASTFKRGMKFINIPTTLLGMCDASIGGKTGVDHQYFKNIVGTFALPEKIFVNPSFLKTLPFVELRSGFAEMLKHGLIADQKHWNDLIRIEELTAENIDPFIERSMQIKQDVVERDFKEENVRKILNFGHTIGHAVESLFLKSGNIIPHGEAVVIGMICEAYLSVKENLISQDDFQIIVDHLNRFYPKLDILTYSFDSIMALMLNDKKNSSKNINFTLLDGIGTAKYDVKTNPDFISESIDFYKNMT